MQHAWSAWPHAHTAWAARTLQRLDPDGIFTVRARLVALTACPVAPGHGGVAEEELVKLEAHDVPRAMVFKEGVKSV